MIKGRINLKKLNLLGYTPETQVFIVQNAGGPNGWSTNTFHFLNRIARHMDRTTDGYAITAPRVEKFKDFCLAQGFEVIEAGSTS
ncbi:hypothetical protein [Bradyrhizobium cenepequi]|uniref:hypothetical protein n=1 Tax=Bradyrhizobium cenepequi TaxID=2821403 RepID=UPI001CE26519|nr:hypothetical protein [Bradyrhizobium cenepequi]MCA6108135.1 hypothetical protein [Bradyrhizobium cenepequi]